MSQGWADRVDRLADRLLPEGSVGLDRQLRLYLGFVGILFVPATLVFAWTDWLRGERVTAVLVGLIAVILISFVHTLRTARDIRWGYRAVLGPAVLLLTAASRDPDRPDGRGGGLPSGSGVAIPGDVLPHDGTRAGAPVGA